MTLKLIVRGRKNAYFYKTLAGAEVGDVLTSVIATCELNGVNLFSSRPLYGSSGLLT